MDKVTQALRDSLMTFWGAGASAARNNKEASPSVFDNEARRLLAAAYAPDRITPEVVEAAARAIVKRNWPGASDADIDEMWDGKVGDAEAALLAAFSVLGGA